MTTADVASRSLSERLAAYWSGAALEELPGDAVAMAKRVLMDTLVVGVRGAESREAAAVTRAARAASAMEAGSSRIWGTGLAAPPSVAALINGTAAHALELDDFGGCGHSGAVVIPAVCAIADSRGASGRTVLKAVIAGYDVASRLLEGSGGYRPHADAGWHSTSTCGTFGAAAAAAAMLELDETQMTWALGIAGSYAGGTWAFLGDGADTKRLHPGRSSEAGVASAYLARSGLTGPRSILDAPWGGYFSTFCGDAATPERTVEALGREFRIMNTGIKLHACCRGLHSPVEALQGLLREHGLRARDIRRIVVHGAERTVRQFSKRDVRTTLDGQFSLPYALAVVAIDGRAGLDQFVPLREDAATRAMIDRVEVRADRALGPYDEPDIEVELVSGAVLAAHVPVAKGAWSRPPDEADMRDKLEALAVPAIGRDRFAALGDLVDRLETVDDFRDVTSLLAA